MCEIDSAKFYKYKWNNVNVNDLFYAGIKYFERNNE